MSSGSITFVNNNTQFVVASKYNPELVAAIKALPLESRRYQASDKTWVIDVGVAKPLHAIATIYDLTIPGDMLRAQELKEQLREDVIQAAASGNLSDLKVLIAKGVPLEVLNDALIAAAEAGCMESVKELLPLASFDPTKATSMKPDTKSFIESYFEGQSLRANLPSLVKPVVVDHEVQKLGRVA